MLNASAIFADWLTIDQAVEEAKAAGHKLEGNNLRKDCRQRFGPKGLAVYVGKEGIRTGGSPEDYKERRGIWLIHRSAVEMRLEERSKGPGNPSWRHQP